MKTKVITMEMYKNLLVFFRKHQYCCTRFKVTKADIEQRQREIMARGLPKKKSINGVKHTLIVASGKGGVGKSTTAVNLAISLKLLHPQKHIGLLDADVFGPSIPLLMNLRGSPLLTEDDKMIPMVNYGVSCMSMGFLVDEKSPVIWRGLMVMSAIDKLLRQVAWNEIDYLIIDTPPGTGDTHLSLIQSIPIAGVLIVTTPQAVAIEVARRGAIMFKKLEVPVVGLVENMSYTICPNCHHSTTLFGQGAKQLATELGVELLEEIPLDPVIAECGDSGKPVVVAKQNSLQAAAYSNLAKKIFLFLSNEIRK